MLRGAIAIFQRDFKKFLSNPFILIMTLAMPIMYLLVFGNAIGGTITGIPIGVIQEQPYITETPLYLTGVDSLINFHNQPDKPALFVVTRFTDEKIAAGALSDGRIAAYVVFPSKIAPDRNIRLYLDSSDYMVPALIQSGVTAAVTGIGVTNSILVNAIYGTIDYLQYFGVGVIVMAIFSTTMFGGGLYLKYSDPIMEKNTIKHNKPDNITKDEI